MASNESTRCRRYFSPIVFAVAWLVIICVQTPAVQAATLSPGDIVIGAEISSGDLGLMAVDPVTGNRTILSDNTHGTGPVFSDPTSVTFAPDGSLLVGDTILDALFRVDPVTGNRTIISSRTVGTGPTNSFVAGQQVGGQIVLSGGSLLSVDPTTGNRTQIPGAVQSSTFFVYGFAPHGSDLIIGNQGQNDIERLDPITGTTTVLSGNGVGSGPAFPGSPLNDVRYGLSGNLYIALGTLGSQEIMSVNPLTGDRAIVAVSNDGTGPVFGALAAQLGVAPNGTLYEGGLESTWLVQIDPATGNRFVLSDATHGTGPLFTQLTVACAVVPNVPEPSTVILAALGGLALLLAYRRRE
jgi:streptogramin lyase